MTDLPEGPRWRRKDWWMYTVVPYQMAYGPISTIIALYILFLHGTVIDVAYASALGYAISIPASVFWGMAIDTYNKRRSFVIISFAGLALSMLALFMVRNLIGAILLYGFISFIVVANSAPFSLLIMDGAEKGRWAEGFAKLQMLSSLGGTLGLVFAFAIAGFVPIDKLILLMVPFCILAIGMSFLITEERTLAVRTALLSAPKALAMRIFAHPLVLGRMPSAKTFINFFAGLVPSRIGKNYLGMFYLASAIFSFGGVLFNTSYPAGLKEFGMQNFTIFGIVLAGYILQTVVFGMSGKIVESREKTGTAAESLAMRSAAYFLIAILFVAFGRTTSAVLNAIIYSIGAGLAYAVFYTVSNVMLFEAIGNAKRGMKIGIYSSMIGLGAILGALMSGYASFYVGYWFTFFLAGVTTVLTAVMFHRLKGMSA